MKQLIFAYLASSDNSNIYPLLLIPCFIMDYLCTCHYDFGNYRMSRLLSLLLLYQCGYEVGKYISFEKQIEKSSISYLETIDKSSIGWPTNENSYLEFIKFFLSTLYNCYKELDLRLSSDNVK